MSVVSEFFFKVLHNLYQKFIYQLWCKTRNEEARDGGREAIKLQCKNPAVSCEGHVLTHLARLTNERKRAWKRVATLRVRTHEECAWADRSLTSTRKFERIALVITEYVTRSNVTSYYYVTPSINLELRQTHRSGESQYRRTLIGTRQCSVQYLLRSNRVYTTVTYKTYTSVSRLLHACNDSYRVFDPCVNK